MNTPRLNDHQSLGGLLATTVALRGGTEALLLPYDLTLSQFAVLREAAKTADGVGPGTLGRQLRLPSATVSRLISQLLASGLIVVRGVDTDRRRRTVVLTRAGRDHYARATRALASDRSVDELVERLRSVS